MKQQCLQHIYCNFCNSIYWYFKYLNKFAIYEYLYFCGLQNFLVFLYILSNYFLQYLFNLIYFFLIVQCNIKIQYNTTEDIFWNNRMLKSNHLIDFFLLHFLSIDQIVRFLKYPFLLNQLCCPKVLSVRSWLNTNSRKSICEAMSCDH